ncbi:hypothetical protein J5Y09_09730 [Roseomonas sp. PWR1]|uniref:Phage holin family protein n=1 Tax=Roseomonas nitratireducens TaxID=2820810 RepID=A0ABS4AS62_9PROT|nr:hypothetical protein [Neoroseomonas nitratireducens]MBP0464191.1 hypothetical protein [Neoroseomonas nitratireducens]
MFRGLHRLLVAAADWQPRDFLMSMIGAEAVTLLAAVSLGFGTFAAYAHLSAVEGPVFAAVVISTAYGVVAVVAGVALARWYAGSSKARPAEAPSAENLEALLRSLAAAGTPQDQMALIAALKVGRDLSPMELLAISLISGFFAGRTAGK